MSGPGAIVLARHSTREANFAAAAESTIERPFEGGPGGGSMPPIPILDRQADHQMYEWNCRLIIAVIVTTYEQWRETKKQRNRQKRGELFRCPMTGCGRSWQRAVFPEGSVGREGERVFEGYRPGDV